MVILSIVIATFNAAKTLKCCLDSIVNQLNEQTELILVDGGSTDETLSIIHSYGPSVKKIISEPDKGIYDAWNKGIALSEGQWIGFIGADDILLPNAILTYLNFIQDNPNSEQLDYICAHNRYVDHLGNLLKIQGEAPDWNVMKCKMAPAHVASLHSKRNLFDSVGKFDITFRICADYELLVRKKHLRYAILPDLIAQMTVGGMSFSDKAIKETYLIRRKHATVSPGTNLWLFAKDWMLFHLFIFRKRIFGFRIK